MEHIDLTGFTSEELDNLQEEIKARKVEVRAEEKARIAEEKAERAEAMKNAVSEGATVTFLYGRENKEYEGTVIRVSDSTATIRSDVFAQNHKDGRDTNYVRYDRIVEVHEAVEATA